MTKSPKYLFTIRRLAERGFITIDVIVYRFRRLPQWETTETDKSTLRFHWQADAEQPTRFYAFRMNVEGMEQPETMLATWGPLVRKLTANIPEALLAQLETAGAVQGEHSMVKHRTLPLSELPPAGTRSYRDVDAEGACTVHGYVEPGQTDEDGAATRNVFRAFTAYAARSGSPSVAARLEAWIQAGKPVAYMDTEREHPAPWRSLFPAEEVAKAS